jgi:hypothetical protein
VPGNSNGGLPASVVALLSCLANANSNHRPSVRRNIISIFSGVTRVERRQSK